MLKPEQVPYNVTREALTAWMGSEGTIMSAMERAISAALNAWPGMNVLPGRSESVDKADAWDAVAAKNAEITTLRAEVERLGRDYDSARDAHDRRVRELDAHCIEGARLRAEVERLRAALRSIAKTTYGYEPFMSDEEAKDYFSSCFFGAQSKARAALKEDGDDTV